MRTLRLNDGSGNFVTVHDHFSRDGEPNNVVGDRFEDSYSVTEGRSKIIYHANGSIERFAWDDKKVMTIEEAMTEATNIMEKWRRRILENHGYAMKPDTDNQ